MRKALFASALAVALSLSAPAHAIIDCWYSPLVRGTVCSVFSVAGPKPSAEQAVTCEDAAWLFWDYCPIVEDTGDGTEDDFMLCEDAPLLVDELCGTQ